MRRFGIAQSFLRIAFEQCADDRSGVGGHRRWVVKSIGENIVRDIGAVVGVERRSKGVQFVDENAQCPPIDVLIVGFTSIDLVGDVFGCAAQSSCSMIFIDVRLRQTEIAQFRVSILEEKDVLRFQISINLNGSSRGEERREERRTMFFEWRKRRAAVTCPT